MSALGGVPGRLRGGPVHILGCPKAQMALVTFFTTIGAQQQSVVEDILQHAFAPGAMNP
jgi:hypothetical protein